jgi:hypothetical protein
LREGSKLEGEGALEEPFVFGQRQRTGAPDRALERAIRRSSPLPLPEDKRLFERTLTLKLRPLAQ